MKGRTFVALALSLAGSIVVGPGCSGSDGSDLAAGSDAGDEQAVVADTGTGGGDGATTECTIDADCTAKLPDTTPPNCAVATCDTLLKKCHFKAKDADGDGHPAKACTATTATIEVGNDCDDTDPNTYPGAWDGPASDADAGPNVEPDRCDQ
jgi:hypothetical protein